MQMNGLFFQNSKAACNRDFHAPKMPTVVGVYVAKEGEDRTSNGNSEGLYCIFNCIMFHEKILFVYLDCSLLHFQQEFWSGNILCRQNRICIQLFSLERRRRNFHSYLYIFIKQNLLLTYFDFVLKFQHYIKSNSCVLLQVQESELQIATTKWQMHLQ